MHSSSSRLKASLRAEMRARRDALSPAARQRHAAAAAAHLLASSIWQKAATVSLYAAVRSEADTALLLRAAWESGKAVFLPYCSRRAAGEMRLVLCSGPEALCSGPYGIPEPAVSPDFSRSEGARKTGCSSSAAPELIIVPGLAFDRSGGRLGLGGGYYDRLLARSEFAASLRMGFAYAAQLADDTLPMDPWDVPMHAVCTEQGILRTIPGETLHD